VSQNILFVLFRDAKDLAIFRQMQTSAILIPIFLN